MTVFSLLRSLARPSTRRVRPRLSVSVLPVAGALVGTDPTEDGVIVGANTAHGSHPYTAGKAIVKIRGYFP